MGSVVLNCVRTTSVGRSSSKWLHLNAQKSSQARAREWYARTSRTHRERAASKRVGKKGSRVEMLNNSLSINRVPESSTVKEPLRDNSKTLG